MRRPTAAFAIAVTLLVTTACGHSRAVKSGTPGAPVVRADASGIPVSFSPEGLLVPGALHKLRQRLTALGLLAPPLPPPGPALEPVTKEALRRFQKTQGLPETGLPSYATIEALGLSVSEIFLDAESWPEEVEDVEARLTRSPSPGKPKPKEP